MLNRLTPILGFCVLIGSPLLVHADTPASTPAPATIAPTSTVPLTVLSNGKFAVDATIDGKGPYSLLVDTGSEVMVIKPDVAKACGVDVTSGTVQVQGPTGGYVDVGQAQVDTVSIAGLTLKKPFCTVEDMSLPCDGIIGAPLFNAGVVRLDLAGRQLTTYAGDSFKPDAGDVELPIAFGKERVPVVASTIGGIDANLEVDTGSSFPAELNSQFVDEHDLREMFVKLGSVQHTSVSGVASSDVYNVQSLSLGGSDSAKIRGQIPALFLDPKPGTPKRDFDGRVGCPLLSDTVITLDYAHLKMYFDPHPSGQQ